MLGDADYDSVTTYKMLVFFRRKAPRGMMEGGEG